MRRLLVLCLIGLFLLPSGLVFAQSYSDEDLVSPATGQAAVVAQGVTTLPAERMRWTVQTAKADPSLDPLEVAGPGFVTADRGAVLVTFATGARNFLGKGESAFIPEDGAEVTVAGEEAAHGQGDRARGLRDKQSGCTLLRSAVCRARW